MAAEKRIWTCQSLVVLVEERWYPSLLVSFGEDAAVEYQGINARLSDLEIEVAVHPAQARRRRYKWPQRTCPCMQLANC